MRFKTLAAAIAFVGCASAAFTQTSTPTSTPTFTLTQAWRTAEAAAPQLRLRQAEAVAAEAVQADAATWLHNNPQLAAERSRGPEWRAGISQTFETGGQPALRRESAAAALSALRSEIEDTRAQLRAEVSEQFHRVLALQQRSAIEADALGSFERTADAVRKRRAAGEDTRLDANVALVEAERARNQLALADEQLLEARLRLAALLQLPPGALPQADGELAAPPPRYTLADLLQAVDAQPRLQALAARENGAAARLKLEHAGSRPDVTLGLSVGRDDMRERQTTLSVSVPLPLFKRNATGIGQARSELAQTQIERVAAARDARAQVSGLWLRLASLRARLQRLETSVLPTLDDNRQLAAKSQTAGQIGLLELIVVNRQGLDARRDLLDALTDYHATRIALERAAGWPHEGNTP